MDIRGFTKIEIVVVVALLIAMIGIDATAVLLLGQKNHDMRALSEVSQIRSALEVYSAKNIQYPREQEIVPLNDSYSETEKLCIEGFVRSGKDCERVLLPFVPNYYASSDERYLYQSSEDGDDYRLQFELISNFSEVQIPKGIHCATSLGITNQPCF